jgi:catechol 2,3-dioxygenase-like lactoylglutathione lyase family enzyme
MRRPDILGIHHLKFPVAELARSLEFYERAFGAERVAAYDHIDASGRLFAYILSVPGLGAPLELRLNPGVAARHQGFDPVTLLVGDRADLTRWIEHFASHEIPHSEILVGAIGWLVVVQDPDGRRLRLYTRETHGPEEKVSWNSPWLQET